MYLGFYNFYSRYNQNRMFTNPRSDIGDELAYPYVRLSQRLTERGIRHATLDMDDLSRFDAVIFFDFPTLLNRYFLRLAARRHPRLYLVLFEGPAVRPDNYFRPHHRPFRKIFTWHSDWVDGKKYLHSPFPIKLPAVAPYTPSQASRFLCMIASQKYSWHRQELYSELSLIHI